MPAPPESERPRHPRWRGIVALLTGLAGLCTIFAAVVTAAEAWREHVQAHWPETPARVLRCDVSYDNGSTAGERKGYFIDCRIGYFVGTEALVARIRSGLIPSPAWPDPGAKIEQMEDWAEAHPPGTPLALRYDPANHQRAVLMATDMPLGGPRTPGNLRVLSGAAAIFALLLVVVAITRPANAG